MLEPFADRAGEPLSLQSSPELGRVVGPVLRARQQGSLELLNHYIVYLKTDITLYVNYAEIKIKLNYN